MIRSPSSSSSPSFKETLSAVMSGFKPQIYKTHDEDRIVTEWTARNNFRFPPPLMSDDAAAAAGSSDRFRVIHEEPRKNTLLYLLLSQYNPWLDCEMTREKRAYLKPRVGEMCYAVYCEGSSSSSSSHLTTQPSKFFRNETVMDIVNLYLWPLLISRADEVIASRTFSDWKRLFTRTITLAFPDYEYWVSIASGSASMSSTFISISDQRRTAQIMKYISPARVLYLLTTSAGLWPYGQKTTSHSSRHGGLCSIKPKIKGYNDKTEIDWLVGADFLRKMKRVHMYFAPLMPQPIIPNTNICDDVNDE